MDTDSLVMIKKEYPGHLYFKLVTFALASILIYGCNNITNGDDQAKDITDFEATVRYIDLEGGFWGLISADGSRYLPVKLEEKYRKDGLNVSVKARILEDRADFRMWGSQVEILEIKAIRGSGNAE